MSRARLLRPLSVLTRLDRLRLRSIESSKMMTGAPRNTVVLAFCFSLLSVLSSCRSETYLFVIDPAFAALEEAALTDELTGDLARGRKTKVVFTLFDTEPSPEDLSAILAGKDYSGVLFSPHFSMLAARFEKVEEYSSGIDLFAIFPPGSAPVEGIASVTLDLNGAGEALVTFLKRNFPESATNLVGKTLLLHGESEPSWPMGAEELIPYLGGVAPVRAIYPAIPDGEANYELILIFGGEETPMIAESLHSSVPEAVIISDQPLRGAATGLRGGYLRYRWPLVYRSLLTGDTEPEPWIVLPYSSPSP